jgi:signal transduction histidine kinase
MVLEGLSNVRRHTCSTQVTVSLACDNGCLRLQIANTVAARAVPPPFVPRSITARATALGGHTRVERSAEHGTVVVVDIPL